VAGDAGIKMINPSPDVTDALADLLAGGVSSESPDSDASMISLDVDPSHAAHECHVQYDDHIPKSFQQAMRTPLAAS
jgi:hypothetical protein